uniref:Uncharacterized protein n=1 Tax=Trypanosoma congolense (strain IL3000) TaxID=1068625 RepID=G0UVV8_TRYCI|nr:conserved hypothetical protein [Trypanosoma congolense IL3000]
MQKQRDGCRASVFLIALQLLSSITAHSAGNTNEVLPCHEVEPFLSQVVPQMEEISLDSVLARWTRGQKFHVICSLSPEKAVNVLLGSSSVHFNSPFRELRRAVEREGFGAGSTPAPSSFILRFINDYMKSVHSYPWYYPVALTRLFLQREVSIRFRVGQEPGGSGGRTNLSAGELLSTAGLRSVRVTSFSPTAASVRHEADRSSDRSNGRSSDSSAGVPEDALPMIPHKDEFKCLISRIDNAGEPPLDAGVASVFEEIGPYRGSSLWISPWLSAWLGRRPMTKISEKVVYDEQGVATFRFDSQVPVIKPVCIGLSSVNNKQIAIELVLSTVFDKFWLKLMLTFFALILLKPWIEEIPALQILIAGIGSVTLVTMILVLYTLRKLQSMTIGKVGLIALVTLGGTAVLAEILLSTGVALYYSFIDSNNNGEVLFLGGSALLAFGLGCGLFSRHYCAEYLAVLTRWTLRVLQLVALVCAALQNREATILSIVLYNLVHPARTLRLLRWRSPSVWAEQLDNEPQETFPIEASREVSYVRPLCVEGATPGGRAAAARVPLDFYSASGSGHTQLALEELARRVNSDPERYTSQLRDPKFVKHWASGYAPS